jgi:UDP-N-acetylmuramoyl-tripeptide--D-alanyl-D-alanine ligase
MLGLTVAEVAGVLGAAPPAHGQRPVRSVVADSRAVEPGALFVALDGARTDGHDHLADAAERGAAAALVCAGRGARPAGLPTIEVADTLDALAALAREHLRRLRPAVFGVTGSVGKTTAKDFLSQLLGGAHCAVHAAPASYNSEIGLPLSVLGAPPGTRALVLEYGVNAPGEMNRLLAIAQPRDAWITAISPVHLAGMGSEETIAREKSLLAAAVAADGRVWLDHAVRARLAAHAVAWTGELRPLPTLRAPGLEVRSNEPLAWRLAHSRLGELELPLVAQHEVELALAAAEIAAAHGVEPAELRARLAALRRPDGRLSVHRYGGITVLDDTYNASPRSMEAALRALARWPRAARRIAVLGSMNELGADAESWHRSVGVRAADLPLDRVVGVGKGGGWIAEAARAAGLRADVHPDAETAAAALGRELAAGDVLLLKASRGERLDRMLEPLARAAPGVASRSETPSRVRAAGAE